MTVHVNTRDHPAVGSASVRRFALQGGIILAVFTTVVFTGIYLRSTWLIRTAVAESASAYIDLVVDTRLWNAMHGGVWVAKSATVRENPYLRDLGVEPDTATVSGTLLTLRNPSAMTSEISVISKQGDGVSFRLTSLDPVNPDHTPDAWERESLKRFESDATELSRTIDDADGRALAVMRPLMVDRSCLPCHGARGYQVGDIRGAISVRVPLGPSEKLLASNTLTLVGLWLTVMVIGGLSMRALVLRTSGRIDVYESRLHDLASTDSLTALSNRRVVLDRLETELARAERSGPGVGVIAVDADHFKRVNDSYGHAAGDTVLCAIANRIAAAVREYDVVGRTGGEEFLVVAPGITIAGLAALAERLRASVSDSPITDGGLEVRMTISLGTALSAPQEGLDDLVARADAALYVAKESGRDRVVAG